MEPTVIPLWPGAAPGSEDWTYPEREVYDPPDVRLILNVARPTITVCLPDPAIANGAGVVVCPGGAFHVLAIDHEGLEVAAWLNAHGIAAFVLKYRINHTGDDYGADIKANLADPARMAALLATLGPMYVADGQQAIRLVRRHATEWGVAPDRVGMMGFSAGSGVTVGVATRHDAESRPDFAGAIYGGRMRAGDSVPSDAPPLFILCAGDDPIAAPGAVPLYEAWRAAGLPAELHIYAQGGHGFGMRPQGLPCDTWIERFADWLKAVGMLNTAP